MNGLSETAMVPIHRIAIDTQNFSILRGCHIPPNNSHRFFLTLEEINGLFFVIFISRLTNIFLVL